MKRKNKIIIIICIGVLFLIEFNYNALQTVDPTFFSGFQKDSESLTVGRIKRSNQEGAYSYGGFLGWNHPDTSMLPKDSNPINNRFGGWGYKVPDYPDKFQFQYQALSNDLTVGHYELYYSQTGLQAFLYYWMGKVFHVSGDRMVSVCHFINSLFLIGLLCAFLWWAQIYFGYLSLLICGLVLLLSQWFVSYADNMLNVAGLFFLPMICSLWYLDHSVKTNSLRLSFLSGIIFITVFTRCAIAGFDFIIAVLVMSVIPILFYAWIGNWPAKKAFTYFSVSSVAALLGMAMGMGLLMIRLGAYHDSWAEAFDYIASTGERRTYGNQNSFRHIKDQSNNISLLHMFMAYLEIDAINLKHWMGIGWLSIRLKFKVLITIILLFTSWVPLKAIRDNNHFQGLRLITWISLISPLGWFTIFKSHSLLHFHTNSILWYMPFLLFGSILFGYTIAQYSKFFFAYLRQ